MSADPIKLDANRPGASVPAQAAQSSQLAPSAMAWRGSMARAGDGERELGADARDTHAVSAAASDAPTNLGWVPNAAVFAAGHQTEISGRGAQSHLTADSDDDHLVAVLPGQLVPATPLVGHVVAPEDQAKASIGIAGGNATYGENLELPQTGAITHLPKELECRIAGGALDGARMSVVVSASGAVVTLHVPPARWRALGPRQGAFVESLAATTGGHITYSVVTESTADELHG